MGRIKNTKTGKITFGSVNKNSGYIRWTFYDPNKNSRREIQAHRAVYETFHPNETLQTINHINGIRWDNRLSNLENISQSENCLKSYYDTKSRSTRLTGQYDENRNLIAIYPSASAAARALGLKDSSNLCQAMSKGCKSHGYYWKELTQEEYNNLYSIM